MARCGERRSGDGLAAAKHTNNAELFAEVRERAHAEDQSFTSGSLFLRGEGSFPTSADLPQKPSSSRASSAADLPPGPIAAASERIVLSEVQSEAGDGLD